ISSISSRRPACGPRGFASGSPRRAFQERPGMGPGKTCAHPRFLLMRKGRDPAYMMNGCVSGVRMEHRAHNQAAGVPAWGVLLILVGILALFGNLGIHLGWIFGLALGTWFVYLGVRHVQEGQPVNWWLVGLGLLIGLGALTSGFAFADKLVFPVVLV